MIEFIHFKDNKEYNLPYSPAVKASGGKLLFLSGITALPVYHHHPHVAEEVSVPEDAESQTRLALNQMGEALRAAGGDFKDVVRVVKYLKDINDQDAVNRVFAEYFPDKKPASTTVQVVSLVDPRLKIELEATAVLER